MKSVEVPRRAAAQEASPAMLSPLVAALVNFRDENPPSSADAAPGKSVSADDVYEEYHRLLAAGVAVDPDEFCARHPAVQSSLRSLIRADKDFEKLDPCFETKFSGRWPEPGEAFLEFDLVGELGRGAFARVYLARDPALGNRWVAVKASPGGGAEAQTLGRINHPNIVPVYSAPFDAGSGLTAVCMPYLGSATLNNVLDLCGNGLPSSASAILDAVVDRKAPREAQADEQPVPPLQTGSFTDGVLWIGAQLADALHFIHRRHQICHLDLKPSNVLMTPAGQPMLLDFNLSADLLADYVRIGGTVPFMSPEQLLALGSKMSAAANQVHAPSDLFSLGVLLYELLSGKHPFGPLPLKLELPEAIALLRERHPNGPIPLRQANPAIAPALARLIESCLAYRREGRPRTGAELATRLRQLRTLEPRPRRWVSRHPWWTAALAALCLGVGTTATAVWTQSDPAPDIATPTDRSLAAEATDPWQLGQQAFAERRYEEARQHFTSVLMTQPNRVDVLLARAQASQQLGESDIASFGDAISDWVRAYKLQPDGRKCACIGYCNLRVKPPEISAARAWLEKALTLDHKRAGVYNDLAYCFLRTNHLDDAETNLTLALELQPEMQAAHHNQSDLYRKRAEQLRGQFPPGKQNPDLGRRTAQQQYFRWLRKAQDAMKKAIYFGPPHVEMFRDAGQLWAKTAEFDQSDISQAVKYLKRAIDRGFDLQSVKNGAVYRAVSKDSEFLELTKQKPQTQPWSPSPRIVDPG